MSDDWLRNATDHQLLGILDEYGRDELWLRVGRVLFDDRRSRGFTVWVTDVNGIEMLSPSGQRSQIHIDVPESSPLPDEGQILRLDRGPDGRPRIDG